MSAAAPANDLSIGPSQGLDHDSIVQPGTSLDEPLVAWTTARFAKEQHEYQEKLRAAASAGPQETLAARATLFE